MTVNGRTGDRWLTRAVHSRSQTAILAALAIGSGGESPVVINGLRLDRKRNKIYTHNVVIKFGIFKFKSYAVVSYLSSRETFRIHKHPSVLYESLG